MIAAPGFRIVGDDRVGDTAHGAFPRCAVAAVVTDDQIRAVVSIGPLE